MYQNALYLELKDRGLKCECQKDLNVYYKNKIVGTYRTDMIVEDAIILELKAVSALRPEHEWQLVNYLKGTNLQVGLLLNFGLRAEMKRLCDENGFSLNIPEPIFCTDNGAMIASAGYYEYIKGRRAGLDLNANPNLKLGER